MPGISCWLTCVRSRQNFGVARPHQMISGEVGRRGLAICALPSRKSAPVKIPQLSWYIQLSCARLFRSDRFFVCRERARRLAPRRDQDANEPNCCLWLFCWLFGLPFVWVCSVVINDNKNQ